LVPIVLGFVLTGAIRFANGPSSGPHVAPAAAGLAFLVAYLVIVGVPPMPPISSMQKLAYATAGGLVLGFLLDLAKAPPPVRWVVFPLSLALILYWVGNPKLTSPEVWAILGFVALWLGAVIGLWRLEAGRNAGLNPAVKLLIASLGVAVIAMFGQSAALAQLGFALATALGGFMLWNWPVHRYPYGAVLLMGVGTALAVIVFILALYTRASVIALAILLLVFFADLVARRIRLGDSGLAKALEPYLLAAICLIPALAAAAVAHFETSPAETAAY
jgi:hypothetical protein